MGHWKRDAMEQFKLLFWVVLLIYLVLAALAVILGRQAGYAATAWICLGFGVLITAVFGGLFAMNLLCVLISHALRRLNRLKLLL